jgi:glycolate oxidase FAD binding subunit
MRCRLSVPPALLEAELGELRRLAGGLGVACSLAGRAANAVLDATCTAADEDALSELVGAVRRRLGGHSGSAASGSLVVRDGPLGLRRRLDVWGPLAPGTLALMREVKQRFDPAAVLAPGRFVGGI